MSINGCNWLSWNLWSFKRPISSNSPDKLISFILCSFNDSWFFSFTITWNTIQYDQQIFQIKEMFFFRNRSTCIVIARMSIFCFVVTDVPQVALIGKTSLIEVESNQQATLVCQASSIPAPHTVHWKRNVSVYAISSQYLWGPHLSLWFACRLAHV